MFTTRKNTGNMTYTPPGQFISGEEELCFAFEISVTPCKRDCKIKNQTNTSALWSKTESTGCFVKWTKNTTRSEQFI